MAKRFKKSGKKDFSRIGRDIRALVSRSAKLAAVEMMNDLAEKGPDWRGTFQNSWVADSYTGGPGSKTSYPYSENSVPEIGLSIAESRSALIGKIFSYTIYNVAPHAEIALDLAPGETYFRPTPKPDGQIVNQGTRRTMIRGDVVTDAEGGAITTAPLDWYLTYLGGGGALKALEVGVKLAEQGK